MRRQARDPCAAQSSLGSDTARLVRVSAADGSEQETLASDPRCDVGSVMVSDVDRSVLAVSFNYLRREWTPLDKDVAADLEVGSSLTAPAVDHPRVSSPCLSPCGVFISDAA